MKKLLKFLGGVAAAAAVIPFAYKKDADSGEKTIHALLWKASIPEKGPDSAGKVKVSLGFNNPFQGEETDDESNLFVSDITIDYAPACSCGEDGCCCESTQEDTLAEEAAEILAEATSATVEEIADEAEICNE